MSSFDPRSGLDRLVGACLSLLVGALALYAAARLVAAVWQILVAALLVAMIVGVAVFVVRQRPPGW
jgi:ABC-type glycerol-3-phosphate transport system permease component